MLQTLNKCTKISSLRLQYKSAVLKQGIHYGASPNYFFTNVWKKERKKTLKLISVNWFASIQQVDPSAFFHVEHHWFWAKECMFCKDVFDRIFGEHKISLIIQRFHNATHQLVNLEICSWLISIAELLNILKHKLFSTDFEGILIPKH